MQRPKLNMNPDAGLFDTHNKSAAIGLQDMQSHSAARSGAGRFPEAADWQKKGTG